MVPLGKDDGGFGLRNPGIKKEEPGEGEEAKEKEGINLGLSGALTKDVNTFNGIVIKYSEPPEARVPKRRWRFYQFKGDEVMPTLHIHRQSAYLIGRDRKVCDIPVDHPSCSKQHAAFQYRLISKKKQDGTEGNRVLPYIIDLGSSNGTFLNNNRIEPQRYYELKEKDVIKFGYSTREYVLLHENSEDEA
jgi:smad nuclear-interacting protein 1